MLLGVSGCGGADDRDWWSATDVRVRVGDDLRWAQPGWNDHDWQRLPVGHVPAHAGPFWVRLDVPLDSVGTPILSIAALAARDVYWDGVLIGRSGRVGQDRARERVGPLDALIRVPDSLATLGAHVVALRMSTFRRPASATSLLLNIEAGDLQALVGAPLQPESVALLFLGGFILVALYYGALYAADRYRTAYLLTALLCTVVAALLVAESWRAVVGYPYDLHAVRLRVVDTLTGATGLLLAATFVVQFDVRRGRTVIAALALGLGATLVWVPDHETGTLAAFALALIAAAGVTGWAVARRRPGARFALGGVVVCLAVLLATGYDFMEGAFFPAFGVLVATLLTSLGLQTRDERRRLDAARAAAARLEAELLKKHLQPHFLMNTLTSVMEWIERDPAQGALAMEALADELRALSEVSGERLIPMAREIALCRAHLDVMGFRHDIRFELDAEGVDQDAPIPPAILHTLTENAVTHNAYPSGVVTLTLRDSRIGPRRTLTMRAPLAGTRRAARPEGGGLRYIRARLEESLPGQWSLESAPEDGDWVTRIDLPAGNDP